MDQKEYDRKQTELCGHMHDCLDSIILAANEAKNNLGNFDKVEELLRTLRAELAATQRLMERLRAL